MEFGFERLSAWQKSRQLVKAVYLMIRCFPNDEKFALSDQLRRAVVSVASNLAEGSGRLSVKEKCHFCQVAYGSLMEVSCQIVLAEDLGFISASEASEVRLLIEDVDRLIRGYHKYLDETLRNHSLI